MKDYNDIKVLLIEGRARQVLPMAKSLRALGCEVTTYNGSKLDPGYASKYPHRKLLAYCNAHDPDGSYRAIRKELEEYINYYNNKRIKTALNNMSPVQYRTHAI